MSYLKYLFVVTCCAQPTVSLAMMSSVDIPDNRSFLSGALFGVLYGGSLVVHALQQDYTRRHGKIVRGEINKQTAKSILGKTEAQQRIKNLAIDQRVRKQEFFRNNDRTLIMHLLKIARFDKTLDNKCVSDHFERILDFLALPAEKFNQQSLQVEKLQLYERLGLRHRLLDDEKKKRYGEHATLANIEKYLFGAAGIAGCVSFYYR